MPIYEYQAAELEQSCNTCKKPYEVMQKINDEPVKYCPDCGNPVTRILSKSNFTLNGTGWANDGYSSPNKKKSELEKKVD